MANYSVEYLNHVLTTTRDEDGLITQQDRFIEQRTIEKLANKRGMRFMKVKDYTRMQEEVITSTLDLKMWNYLVNCYSKAGLCRVNGEPVTITILTKHFNVTRQKVSKFIKKCIDAGFLMKSGTSLLLNPLVVVPYGINDADLYLLQQTWIRLSEKKDS